MPEQSSDAAPATCARPWEKPGEDKEAWKDLPGNRYSAEEWRMMIAKADASFLDHQDPVLCDT